MLKVIIISIILLGLAFVGLAFRALFISGGRFPKTSIGKNKHMRELGITCVKHDELNCHRQGVSGGCGCA